MMPIKLLIHNNNSKLVNNSNKYISLVTLVGKRFM